MKPYPHSPRLDFARVAPERMVRLLTASQALDDDRYFHWEDLRHRAPPPGLSVEDWWFALKLRRMGGAIRIELLQSDTLRPIAVARHARVEAGMAEMDRLLAGRVAMPEEMINPATRDQFIASSLMEEAIHSSLFEGASSTREVAKEMLRTERRPADRDERMILNNYRAMERIRELRDEPLSMAHILELHRIITEGTLDDPAMSGRIQRPGETRIRVIDDRVDRVVHVPPPAGELPTRLARLVEFANADDVTNGQYIHPVLRSILLHFQLAYDHPFYDGNGRTARAVFYWSMLRRGYWLAEYLSISRLLHRKRRPYERAFLLVESDDYDGTYFVLQQLGVLKHAVAELFEYVSRKTGAIHAMRARVKSQAKLNHRQMALLDHALRKPGAQYTHASHARSHRISIVTARSDMMALVELGMLQKRQVGKKLVYEPVGGSF